MRNLIGLIPLAAISALFFAGPVSAQDYRLQPGDILQFSILGANSVNQRLTVDLGGQVNVPVGGSFEAAGRTIEDLRQSVVDRLKSGSFPLGTDESGGAIWATIFPEVVVLDIAEYRPIFLSGDVLTPGAQAFRPGTTVRQAISVAGGASPFRSRLDPSLELLGAEDKQRTLMARETSFRLELARLEAELAGADAPAFDAVLNNGLDRAGHEALQSNEQETFETRERDFVERRNTISDGIRTIERRSELLAESQKNLENENQLYREELERVQGLYSQGLVRVGRLNEAQRLLFLVASRALDTSAEISRLERELFEMRRSYEEAATDRRMQNLESQKQAFLSLLTTQSELARLRQRLEFLQPRGVEPTVEIVRAGEAGNVQAGLDTLLMPGDTVVVRLNDVPEAQGIGRQVSIPSGADRVASTVVSR